MSRSRRQRIAQKQQQSRGPRVSTLLKLGGAILFAFTSLCLWIEWQGRQEELVPAGAIVVLGAAQWSGQPSPVLQARLDQAITLYRQGYAPVIVLTGGSLPGDPYSEASVGQEYALAQGIPAEAILLETQSRTTVQNLRGAWELLSPRQVRSILLVSDPFHMARACSIARALGFTVHPAPTHSSPIGAQSIKETWYVLREALGLIAYWVAGQ